MKTSEKIMTDTYGENSLEYVVTVLNQIVLEHTVHHDITKLPRKLSHVEKTLDQIDTSHHLTKCHEASGFVKICIAHTKQECLDNQTCSLSNIWEMNFFTLFDWPIKWIDYAPMKYIIALRSDLKLGTCGENHTYLAFKVSVVIHDLAGWIS